MLYFPRLPVNHKQQRKREQTELPGAHPSDTGRAGGTAHGPPEGKASRRGFQMFWRQVYQASPPKYYDHEDISRKISFKFLSVIPPSPPPIETIKKRTTKKQEALIKWLQPSLLVYFRCTLWSNTGTRGFLASVNRKISEIVPEYVQLETGKAGSFLLSSVLHSEIHNCYSHDSDDF